MSLDNYKSVYVSVTESYSIYFSLLACEVMSTDNHLTSQMGKIAARCPVCLLHAVIIGGRYIYLFLFSTSLDERKVSLCNI